MFSKACTNIKRKQLKTLELKRTVLEHLIDGINNKIRKGRKEFVNWKVEEKECFRQIKLIQGKFKTYTLQPIK